MTCRDERVIAFFTDDPGVKAARASTLIELFYKNPVVGRRRLTELVRLKKLKRERENNISEYIYYLQKPKQLIHSMLVADFYLFLSKYATIEKFKLEVPCGSIRPDAVFVYERDGQRLVGFLEVEISHKGLDREKYVRYKAAREYEKKFHMFPAVWLIKKEKGIEREISNLHGYRIPYKILNLAIE